MFSLTLGGCIAAVRHNEPPPASVTIGQQLIDLQKAKDAGVITESEFQAPRAKFLAQQ
ncbi:MAG TPA: SHOCT domain-containing protein [Opitutaceae bacterium]|nr:SHOCT domain-containing protein [Opitutaceae bacterium]